LDEEIQLQALEFQCPLSCPLPNLLGATDQQILNATKWYWSAAFFTKV